MILTIKGADFSSANIGTLSTFVVSKSIGRGASFDIPSFVEKNSSVNWVITLGEDYTFGTYSVTMGGEVVTPTVNGSEMTIAIANVTGNIRITVATVYNGVEELPEPDEPVVPPVDGVINYFNLNDPDVIRDKSINESGSIGTQISNYGVTGWIPCKKGDVIRAGRYKDGAWTANNNVVACFYDESKNFLSGAKTATDYSSTSGIENDRIYTPTNADTAYARISIKIDFIDYFMVTINEDGIPTEYIPYNYQG